MSVKAIIELQAKPGKRAELLKALDDVLENRKHAPGFINVMRYEVIDDHDKVVEIAEWVSPEARQTWLEQSMESGVLNRLMGMLSVPFKAITVRELE